MQLIIYELNELPLKVFRCYALLNPNTFLGRAYREARYRETFTPDQGELHPWSTWPTVYRGVDNTKHKITTLNQDLEISKQYPAVWEVLRRKGVSTGIFGSLQSGNVCKNRLSSFHLPHTFAENNEAYPSSLIRLQDFNLKACKINKGTAGKISLSVILSFAKIAQYPRLFAIIIKTILKSISNTILGHRLLPMSALQSDIMFNAFELFLGKYNPKFSTFFTNHLASVMHRYWDEAFGIDPSKEVNMRRFKKSRIYQSMKLADDHLESIYRNNKEHESKIWIISSMGQEYIYRGKYLPEPRINSEDLFLKKLPFTWTDRVKSTPSMYPDFVIEAKNADNKNIIDDLLSIKYKSGKSFFSIRYTDEKKINLKINACIEAKNCPCLLINNKEYDFNYFSIELLNRKHGTGYHQPFGIWISTNKSDFEKTEKIINTTEFKSRILQQFG